MQGMERDVIIISCVRSNSAVKRIVLNFKFKLKLGKSWLS